MKCRPIISTWVALLAVAIGGLSFAGGAGAELTGGFTKFQNCDSTSTSVTRCLYSVTDGGEVVLGRRKVPIVNPVILQAGYNSPSIEKHVKKEFSRLSEPTNGVTLSKVSQPIPGGLAGLVNCDEIPNILLSMTCGLAFENSLTGVKAVLELARPTSAIRISENHLAEGLGVALVMPIKVHLISPLLGDSCYVGSSGSPVIWSLTSGLTTPRRGTAQLTGTVGEVEYLEKAWIVRLSDSELVDSVWAAPKATGCGGPLSFLINPLVNASLGLPTKGSNGVAQLKSTIYTTTVPTLKKVSKENQ